MKPDVRVCADVNELSRRAAEAAVRTINDAARGTGRYSLVLSGGNTPRTLYGFLASEFRDQIPWARVHVFWGDERYVSPDDPDSNYRMAGKRCWITSRVRRRFHAATRAAQPGDGGECQCVT